jgi:uncharacterized membrane protein (DUF4010 family)
VILIAAGVRVKGVSARRKRERSWKMNEASLNIAARLAIASLVGLAAGLEREWSGHTVGADARFAGIRTFFLLGLTGGIVGVLADASFSAVAAALALGASALCVAAYVTSVRRVDAEPEGTTEAAALTIIGLGVIAGIGLLGVAAGAGAVTVLMLREKERLHRLVHRLGEPELRAGLQFAVLAVVVLPLLPAGPFLGALAIKPRALWTIVLVFTGLNFAGFIARRIVGPARGSGIAGALGGLLSSTAVTITFSRQSRSDPRLAAPLARGVIAACTVLVPRVLITTLVLNRDVARALLPMLLPMFVIGIALVAIGWRSHDGNQPVVTGVENPLRFFAAVQMAIAFQGAMLVIALVQDRFGAMGIYATATALGLTDVDALTVSMSRPEAVIVAGIAATAIAIGIISNTMLKLAVVVVLGEPAFRRRAGMGLVVLAAAGAVGVILL